MLNKIKKVLSSVALIKQIAVGLVIGILIAVFTPTVIPVVKIFWRSLRQSTERRCSRPRIFPCHERDGTKKKKGRTQI